MTETRKKPEGFRTGLRHHFDVSRAPFEAYGAQYAPARRARVAKQREGGDATA